MSKHLQPAQASLNCIWIFLAHAKNIKTSKLMTLHLQAVEKLWSYINEENEMRTFIGNDNYF